MLKKVLIILGLLIFFFAQKTSATLVEITVGTDKDVYELGEEVRVYVSVYNPGLPVTLTFGSTLQASYLMDGTYYWHQDKYFLDVITNVTIDSNATHTWELVHGMYEMESYPLDIGIHTLVGKVMAWQLIDNNTSEVICYEVIPEPVAILLFGIGGLLLRRRQSG